MTSPHRQRASLRNRLIVHVVLPIRGGKRRYASVERTSRHIAAQATRPSSVSPPRRLRRRVVVRRQDRQSWPVYNVEPLGGPEPARTVLYFHGGAYINEITRYHWSLGARMAREASCRCVVPIYPLGARAGAARVVATAADIAGELAEEAGDLVLAGELILAGDSAGGGLALATGLALRDRGLRPARIILLSPWLDARTDRPQQAALEPRDAMLAAAGLREAARTYACGLPLDDPRISPLNGELRGLAPIAVFTGTHDILNPDSHRLRERCHESEVACELIEAPGMPHVYALMPTPEGRNARRRLVELLRDT